MLAQGDKGAVYELPLLLRLTNDPVSFATYLVKAVVPWSLAVYYPHPARR